jgi:hypothetical protein
MNFVSTPDTYTLTSVEALAKAYRMSTNLALHIIDDHLADLDRYLDGNAGEVENIMHDNYNTIREHLVEHGPVRTVEFMVMRLSWVQEDRRKARKANMPLTDDLKADFRSLATALMSFAEADTDADTYVD